MTFQEELAAFKRTNLDMFKVKVADEVDFIYPCPDPNTQNTQDSNKWERLCYMVGDIWLHYSYIGLDEIVSIIHSTLGINTVEEIEDFNALRDEVERIIETYYE